jgi:alpha-galactosidase
MGISFALNSRRFRFFIAAVLVLYLLLVSSLSNNHILALNNGLALTPPMGWNSWNTFPYNPTDALIREIADAMVSSGMKDAGYQYINIDDGWWNNNLGPTGNGRDASGNIIPNPEKFPNGMKAVVDYIHSKGLKAGIYTDIGPTGCGLPHGSYGFYQQDANQFAAWGFDLVKLDACGGSQGSNHQTRYEQFRDALANSGRPIVFSICEWGTETPWVWGPNTGNYWRVGYDIDNQGSLWDGVIYEIDKSAPHAAAAGPGHWNDPDMMEVGVRGTLTSEENKAHFSMWAILAAPMIAGNDLRNMTPEVRDILTNSEVIAVDQDSLGKQGTLAEEAITGQQVWSKVLGSDTSGRRAVALFNRTGAAADITVHWNNIGLTGTHTVRDLWQHSEKGSYSSSYTANVASHGVVMLLIRGTGEPTYTPGPTSTPTPPVTSYEAESSANTLSGTAAVTNKSSCSGGKYVGFVGNGANNTLQFNNLNAGSGGSYPLTIYYLSGEDRTAYMSVNGGTRVTVSFPNIGNWDTVGTKVVTVDLVSGNNTIILTMLRILTGSRYQFPVAG